MNQYTVSNSNERGRFWVTAVPQRVALVTMVGLLVASMLLAKAVPTNVWAQSRAQLPATPPNTPPVITTDSLPKARIHRRYRAVVEGFDANNWNNLTLALTGLPRGLKSEPCSQTSQPEMVTISCPISGRPRQRGLFPVLATLTDDQGGKTDQTLKLRVK